jgi:L-iditol 2-dehydrogenase
LNAYVLREIGDFYFEEVPDPIPGEGEVIIAVKASGICGSDIPRIFKSGAHTYPLIPGHEFSGVVINLGMNVDSKWLGKRVGIFPLIPCRKCESCRKKQYEMCKNYSYLGSRRNGGFAEYTAVPVENLIELPDQVSFDEAAMLEPMAVAVHAIRRIQPHQQDTIAVCGLGTIGLLLLKFLKEAGMKHVLAIGNKESQKEIVLRMGVSIEEYCDCREMDAGEWIKAHTEGRGVDVFFECVGRNETFELAVDNAASAGKIMLVGNPNTDMTLEKPIYWKILRNQLTVIGTWNSSFTHDKEDDWHYVIERLKQNTIIPTDIISHRLPLDKLEIGFTIMRDKTEDYVKIMGNFED